MKALRERYVGAEAAVYEDKRQGDAQWGEEGRAVRRALLDVSPGGVLDVPCGTGRFFPFYRELEIDAVGVDVSPDMLRQARARGWDDVWEGDVFTTPFADDSFDMALCVRFLNWTTERECVAVLEELARLAPHVCVSLGIGEGYRGRTPQHPESVIGDAGLSVTWEEPIITTPKWRYSVLLLER